MSRETYVAPKSSIVAVNLRSRLVSDPHVPPPHSGGTGYSTNTYEQMKGASTKLQEIWRKSLNLERLAEIVRRCDFTLPGRAPLFFDSLFSATYGDYVCIYRKIHGLSLTGDNGSLF